MSQTYETLYERALGSVGNIFPDDALRGVALTGKFTDTVDRDGLRRPSVRKLTLSSASSPLMTDTYGYLARTGGGTTSYVSSLSNTVGNSTSSLSYKYNNNGNITEISENGTLKYKYTYDSLNRLTREDNYDAGVSYTWTYGCSTKGNLESKTKYLRNSSDTEWVQTAQTNYSYGSSWKDALTSFGNETITYDAIGNPTTYRGKALTWTNVRRLASFGSNTFQYGADGIRYKKNNITYTLDGNRILKETDGTRTLTYYYGTSGVIGFRYNGADYYYRKNLQGDIIAIYNTSGTKVASYVYNAWGEVLKVTNHTSANIGDINPFRYRSYYYDTETKLYYLEIRYYDPEVGRFINADDIEYLDPETIGGLNLFAYCGNSPINYKLNHSLSIFSLIGMGLDGFYGSIVDALKTNSMRTNWGKASFQIPLWVSSLMSASDFGASVAPTLRTFYQYIRYPGISDLNKLYGLDYVPGTLNKICSTVGYTLLGVDILFSAISNFTNDNLTKKQKWISSIVDAAYIAGTVAIGNGVAALVSLIPVVGVFIAPFAAAGVTWLIDKTNDTWGWLDDIKQFINDL